MDDRSELGRVVRVSGITGLGNSRGEGVARGAGETFRIAPVLVQEGRVVVHTVLPIGILAPACRHHDPGAMQVLTGVE